MVISRKLKILIISVALLPLFFSQNVQAQSDSLRKNFLYKNQIKFSLTGCLYDNIKIDRFGEKLLKSYPLPSGELAISYYNHIKNGFGINVGLGLGLAPFNLHFNFKSPDNSIFNTGPHKDSYDELDCNFTEYVQSLYTLPLSIQKTFSSKKNYKMLYFVEAGAKLNYQVAYPYVITGGIVYVIDDATDATLFGYELRDHSKRILVSYFFKFGFQKILKKINTLQCGLVLNYSPSKIGKGNYTFSNLPTSNYGNISQNINYIGVEFVYGLTLSRRLKEKK